MDSVTNTALMDWAKKNNESMFWAFSGGLMLTKDIREWLMDAEGAWLERGWGQIDPPDPMKETTYAKCTGWKYDPETGDFSVIMWNGDSMYGEREYKRCSWTKKIEFDGAVCQDILRPAIINAVAYLAEDKLKKSEEAARQAKLTRLMHKEFE